MLLTKEVEVKVNSYTVDYYKSLGYEIPMKKATESTRKKYKKDFVYDFSKTIIVQIQDLQMGSHIKVDVLCDYCKKNVITMKYKDYYNRMKITNKHACIDCSRLKLYESNLSIYNVKNASQSDEVKRRMASTNIKKYGTIAPAQNKDVQEKMKDSYIRNYGVDNPMKCLEIKEKLAQTFYLNGMCKTSRQQIYLFNLYGEYDEARINFPISYYAADICLLREKIVIEYDGGGHELGIVLGSFIKEEFHQREVIRNSVVKREGYKQIRIISSKDFLPSDLILLQMLSESRQYFSEYPNHSWIEFNIDSSIMRNAEHKEGVLYDYGILRTIKDSDLLNEVI